MKVQVDGKEFWIEFQHIYKKGLAQTTWCLIRDATNAEKPFGPDNPPIAVRAAVIRYYQDPPNKEKARKAALAKALDRLYPPITMVGARHSEERSRAMRKAFWEVYLNRKRVTPSAGDSRKPVATAEA